MNPISEQLSIGTVGELLVQLRLLQFNVQAAPPLKDSGNDLIAVKGKVFRAIQVKTTRTGNINRSRLPKKYHILAVVYLAEENTEVYLDQSKVFLVPRDRVAGLSPDIDDLDQFKLNAEHINRLFSE